MWTAKQYIEIFHLIFIRHLESKLDKDFFALKGGCNLRFFYKSIRYSEDIDFDIRIVAKQTLQKKINKLLASPALLKTLHSKGIEIAALSEPKQTDTTQRWKIHLHGSGLSVPMPTKIEFSRRNQDDGIGFSPVDNDLIQSYQLYPIITNHYLLQTAFNQKVEALIHRSVTQARDIFDLKLLLDLNANANKLSMNAKKNIHHAIENAMTIGFSEFKSQVLSYLLKEYQDHYNSAKIWKSIQSEIIDVLEKAQL